MNNQDLNNILRTLKALPDGNDAMARAVLKAAVDSVTLETLQKLLPTAKATTDKKVVGNRTKGEGSTGSLKFTKKEIDSMSEPVKILLIYSGYEIRYRMIKNTYQVRFRRDGYNIELCALDLQSGRIRKVSTVGVNDSFQVEASRLDMPFAKFDGENLPEVGQVQVKYTNIDFAGHTNNKEYIRFALNTFSVQELTARPIEEFDIAYVNQTYENDVLSIFKSSGREGDIIAIKKDDKLIAKCKVVRRINQ